MDEFVLKPPGNGDAEPRQKFERLSRSAGTQGDEDRGNRAFQFLIAIIEITQKILRRENGVDRLADEELASLVLLADRALDFPSPGLMTLGNQDSPQRNVRCLTLACAIGIAKPELHFLIP